MPPTDFAHEARLPQPVAGVDEVGRGPWAGPIVAAAVILDRARVPPGLDDSKRLTPARRAALVPLILAHRAALGIASVAEIDALGLGPANDLAMRRALAGLPAAAALVDGNRLPRGLTLPALALIGGDGLSPSIAAASVLAKVCRDRLMARLALAHPGYGWQTNMGYGTADHRAALARLGLTPHHRRSFRPIHQMLCEESRTTP